MNSLIYDCVVIIILKTCNECGSEFLDDSIYCGVCGERLPEKAPSFFNRYKIEKVEQPLKKSTILYPTDVSTFDWVEKEQTLFLKITIYILMISAIILVITAFTYLFQSFFLFNLYISLGILQYLSSIGLSKFNPISRIGGVISTLPIVLILLFNLELFLAVLLFYGIIYYSIFLDPDTILFLNSREQPISIVSDQEWLKMYKEWRNESNPPLR